MRFLKQLILIGAAFLLFAAVFISGVYIGTNLPSESQVFGILHKDQPELLQEEVDFSLFWDAWSLVEDRYVDIEKVKRQDMVYGAVSGLLRSLGDQYSVFFSPEDFKIFQSEISGSFEGVGMEIGLRKGIITVIAPLKETPAERSGIRAGDKIVKINATSTIDFTVEEAVRLIRGPRGTSVKLTILRNGEDDTRDVEITRDVIQVPVLSTNEPTVTASDGSKKKIDVPSDIFVLQLHNFSEKSPLLFQDAVRKMALEGRQKLILDVRNNPGGFLESSVQIGSFFLPQDKLIVEEDYGKGGKRAHRSNGYDVFRDLPMIILVNQGSASASEILAGALQDYGLAKVVGEKTFGKGSVQELLPLIGDAYVKITVAKWLTPNGRDITAGGIIPDYEVKTEQKDIDAGRDPAMEKAIELLKNANGRL